MHRSVGDGRPPRLSVPLLSVPRDVDAVDGSGKLTTGAAGGGRGATVLLADATTCVREREASGMVLW